MEAEIVLDNPSPIRYLAPEQFGNQEISVCPVICKGNVYTAQLNVLNSRENDVDELIASFDVLKANRIDIKGDDVIRIMLKVHQDATQPKMIHAFQLGSRHDALQWANKLQGLIKKSKKYLKRFRRGSQPPPAPQQNVSPRPAKQRSSSVPNLRKSGSLPINDHAATVDISSLPPIPVKPPALTPEDNNPATIDNNVFEQQHDSSPLGTTYTQVFEQQKKLRQEKIHQEKILQEKLRQEKIQQEKLQQEKIRQEKLRQEKLRQEKIQQEKLRQEKIRQEKLRQEKLRQEKIQQEKIQQEKLRQEKIRQEKIRQEKIQQEKLRQEKMRQEKIRQEKIRQEKIRQEKIQQETIRRLVDEEVGKAVAEAVAKTLAKNEAERDKAVAEQKEKNLKCLHKAKRAAAVWLFRSLSRLQTKRCRYWWKRLVAQCDSGEPAGVEEALHTHRLSVEMELAPPSPRGMPRPQRNSILPGGFVVSTAGTLEQTIGVEEALPTSRQPLEMELAPPKPHGAARPQRDSVLPGGFLVSSEGTLKQNRISVDERAINEATDEQLMQMQSPLFSFAGLDEIKRIMSAHSITNFEPAAVALHNLVLTDHLIEQRRWDLLDCKRRLERLVRPLLSRTLLATRKRRRERVNVIRELMQTEYTYIKAMGAVVEKILDPLEKAFSDSPNKTPRRKGTARKKQMPRTTLTSDSRSTFRNLYKRPLNITRKPLDEILSQNPTPVDWTERYNGSVGTLQKALELGSNASKRVTLPPEGVYIRSRRLSSEEDTDIYFLLRSDSVITGPGQHEEDDAEQKDLVENAVAVFDKRAELEAIFRNMRVIQRMSCQFFTQLLKLITNEKAREKATADMKNLYLSGPFQCDIKDINVDDGIDTILVPTFERFLSHFQLYSHYVVGFDKSDETLKQMNARKRKGKSDDCAFCRFHRSALKIIPCTRGLKLESILIMPVQRLPRYKLLLQSLVEQVPEKSLSRDKLRLCVHSIDSLLASFNEKANAEILARVSRRFAVSFDDNDEDPLSPMPSDIWSQRRSTATQKVLYEGSLELKGRFKSRRITCVLLTDKFLYGTSKKDQGTISLVGAKIWQTGNKGFVIEDATNKKHTFTTTVKEKSTWVLQLKRSVAKFM